MCVGCEGEARGAAPAHTTMFGFAAHAAFSLPARQVLVDKKGLGVVSGQGGVSGQGVLEKETTRAATEPAGNACENPSQQQIRQPRHSTSQYMPWLGHQLAYPPSNPPPTHTHRHARRATISAIPAAPPHHAPARTWLGHQLGTPPFPYPHAPPHPARDEPHLLEHGGMLLAV
eukprot:353700-Chlamydomonas_euryale.AAC.1